MLRLYFAEGAPSAHLLRRHSLGFVSGTEGGLQGALRLGALEIGEADQCEEWKIER